MPAYSTTADVEARLSGRDITADSSPNVTEVTAWISEAEARLNNELAAAGFVVPVTDANGILVVKDVVVSRVAARVSRAYATIDATADITEAKDLIKEWDDFLAEVRSSPARIATLIGQPFGSAADRGNLRTYTRDNSTGKSVGNGDFDPIFRKDDDL